MMGQLQAVPCGDCIDGYCTMNCGPVAKKGRRERAIEALRKPDHSLARVPNTVRESLAEVIEETAAERDRLRALNAELLQFVVAVSRYFIDTDAPLGQRARDLLDKAEQS